MSASTVQALASPIGVEQQRKTKMPKPGPKLGYSSKLGYSWWTFRIFFIFSGRGSPGRGEGPGGRGGGAGRVSAGNLVELGGGG